MTIRAVVFDVGETLLSDAREWEAWIRWINVPRHVFYTVLGAVTAAGRNNAETFQYFKPGFDLAAERQAREQAGQGESYDETDLYPDVRTALTALRDMGIWVGIAGNQTARAATLLRALNLPADALATSGEWGIAKPDLEFFARVIAMTGYKPGEVAYVGDHRNNDIIPARAAGLRPVLIRRGPWGYLWAEDPTVTDAARWRIDSLTELPDLIAAENANP